jgi:phosphate transport system substrate-binding protein
MASVSGKSGKCSNFGNCSIADSRSPVDVPTGLDFVCHECGKPLLLRGTEGGGSRSNAGLIVAALVVLLLGAAGVSWFLLAGKDKTEVAVGAPPDRPGAPATSAPGTVLLRIAGSNTLGSRLVPALAESYLKGEGATSVARVAGASPVETSVQGRFPDGSVKSISIAAHGSSTAFDGLARGDADIGMSSRRITPTEVTKLVALGDLTTAAGEHVVGLDGLAVIVHKSNLVPMLTKGVLGDIFAGTITDWGQIAGAARGKSGPISLYARDENSGTFDTFKQLVLGSGKLAAGAKRFEDSAQLSDAVANDPNAIGFIGLPYVRNARAIGVAEKGATALLPNRFTVATEDYALSRRLYLYTSTAPKNNNVARFIDFAKAKSGQEIVAQQGFIEQTVRAQDKPGASEDGTTVEAPAQYRQATANATRLSLNFRFRSGSKELDNKAVPDLDRVVTFLSDMRTPPGSVVLIGFADSRGAADANVKLSQDRAQTVAGEFKQRGIAPAVVTGFGSALPVATNETPEGQEKNRRVEIWVKR